MLQALRIKNYALIDEVDIQFNSGFTTITGETGAGKSILLGALSLLLGSRADTSVLKDPALKSVCEAQFQISAYKLQKIFSENDVDYDDETVIRREITPAGKSRSFVNDTPVNLSFLKLLGSELIEIHSQNSNVAMSDPNFQMEVVDLLAGNAKLLSDYSLNFNQYKKLTAQLADILRTVDAQKKDADFKQFLFDELKVASVKSGEQVELEQEFSLQSNLEEIKSAVQLAISTVENEDTGCQVQLNVAVKSLVEAGKFNNHIAEIGGRVQSILIELSDVSSELNRLESSFEHDPERLEYLRARLDLIYHLQQKHKVASDTELVALCERLGNELELVNNLDEHIIALETEIEKSRDSLQNHASSLRANRNKIIPKIEKNIVILLRSLGMVNAELKISLEGLDEFNSTGLDSVSFLFSANKNSPLRLVSETASGGEVSRIMLCLKSIISQSKQLPTIVFDEIDIGVSGDIAEKMGLIMKDMSNDMQVISITHLPQIASKGTHHFAVYKKDTAHTTNTEICLLDEKQRVEEVAKMLSGRELTEAALQNATNLLKG